MPSWPGPRRIAHRGGGTLAPENTLAGIREAIARGYRGVEFDVMLTADDVPVLMHDPQFGRTIAGVGTVATTTWADLSRRDAGGWFAERFRGERVPRLDDVVAFCRAHGVWMNIEIKPTPGADECTGRIVAERVGAAFRDGSDPPLLSSFSVVALGAARAAARHVPRAILLGRLPGAVLDSAIAVATGIDCVSVHVDHRQLTKDAIASFHRAGLAVMAYTVNDPSRVASMCARGVDAICTDRIDLIEADA